MTSRRTAKTTPLGDKGRGNLDETACRRGRPQSRFLGKADRKSGENRGKSKEKKNGEGGRTKNAHGFSKKEVSAPMWGGKRLLKTAILHKRRGKAAAVRAEEGTVQETFEWAFRSFI